MNGWLPVRLLLVGGLLSLLSCALLAGGGLDFTVGLALICAGLAVLGWALLRWTRR